MRSDEMWLVGIFSMVCCVLSVWPRFTAKILSYGKLPKSQGLIDAFQFMGCAGLVLVEFAGRCGFSFEACAVRRVELSLTIPTMRSPHNRERHRAHERQLSGTRFRRSNVSSWPVASPNDRNLAAGAVVENGESNTSSLGLAANGRSRFI
jgi:hypothetical protein